MITFAACLWRPPINDRWGYTPDWANRLFSGIRRHYRGDFRAVLLHDGNFDLSGLKNGAEAIEFAENAPGWGRMMEAWRPEVVGSGRLVVLGLDTVITGDITEICDLDCEIGLPTDPYHPPNVCNGVGLFSNAAAGELWDTYQGDPGAWHRKAVYGGQFSEMMFLRKVANDRATRLEQVFPDQIVSYKVHKPDPNKARIVYFHGRPKPNQVKDPWIVQNWTD